MKRQGVSKLVFKKTKIYPIYNRYTLNLKIYRIFLDLLELN